MEAKLLSECGTKYVIDENPKDRYEVEIEPGEFLAIEAGCLAGSKPAAFSHPNMAASSRRIYHFRTYFKSGAKRWYSKAGVSHIFVVPRSAVKLLPEKGYSYIRAEINGVKVRFNVSGGGGSGCWTDYLYTKTTISVGHGVKQLKAIAAVAVRGTPLEPFEFKPMDANEEAEWNRIAARSATAGKEQVAKLTEDKKQPVVCFLPGFSYDGVSSGKAISVQRQRKKIEVPPEPGYSKAWRYEYTGAVREFILDFNGFHVRAKASQIDWAKTLEANGVPA